MDTLIWVIGIAAVGYFISKVVFGNSTSEEEENEYSNKEENQEDEEEKEDDDENLCDICERKIREDEETYTCDECENENICEDCICGFTGVNLCKSCLKKECPQKVEIKTEYKDRVVEKIVYVDKEGIPLNTTFNPFAKTEFD